METILAPTRRSLPPVPRSAATAASDVPFTPASGDPSAAGSATASPSLVAPASADLDDIAQAFVTRLRAAAADFAEAAGAERATVCEAVPPARHRRSRCRLVLQYADGTERDLTFLGAPGSPSRSRVSFDRHIQGWLRSGQVREPAWLVADADTADGVAIDVPAWLATDTAR
jgi:hypothetical protein